jgi:mannitol-1-/sugar-/sorbitol-6-phosphatase
MGMTLLCLGVIQINCSALLFDMDGVLIDSTPAVARVWSRWATAHGLDPAEVTLNAHGRPSISTIREYLPNADHDKENLIVERGEIEDLDGVVPLPGAVQLLSDLPENRWAIVTSCTRALAEVRIRAAGLPQPRLFITASEVVHGKPHPEPYLKAAKQLGFAPEACVVVEDAPAGIRSGKSAGSHVLALRTTILEAALIEAGADWIVDNCSQVSARAAGAGMLNLSLGISSPEPGPRTQDD